MKPAWLPAENVVTRSGARSVFVDEFPPAEPQFSVFNDVVAMISKPLWQRKERPVHFSKESPSRMRPPLDGTQLVNPV